VPALLLPEKKTTAPMRRPAACGVNVTLTTQLIAAEYFRAVHVLPAALAKSRFALPVVSTPMLPTLVPEETENVMPFAALGVPMACEPKFLLAEVPAKFTCARADGESSRMARIIGKREWQIRCDGPLPDLNSNDGMMETSLSGGGVISARKPACGGD
jgi:hypothetical protein